MLYRNIASGRDSDINMKERPCILRKGEVGEQECGLGQSLIMFPSMGTWGISGTQAALQSCPTSSKRASLLDHIKAGIGCGLPPDRGMDIIFWVKLLLSTENSSPERSDRESNQPMLYGLGLGCASPVKWARQGTAVSFNSPPLALLTSTVDIKLILPRQILQDSGFKIPGEIFKRRISGMNSSATTVDAEAVTDTLHSPSLPPHLRWFSLSNRTSKV